MAIYIPVYACECEYVKNHVLFGSHPKALQIIACYDYVEMVDPQESTKLVVRTIVSHLHIGIGKVTYVEYLAGCFYHVLAT